MNELIQPSVTQDEKKTGYCLLLAVSTLQKLLASKSEISILKLCVGLKKKSFTQIKKGQPNPMYV